MIVYQNRINNDANSRIATYESLLDLFTLFSFILIFAAFIYVTQYSNNRASVSAQNAISGSGVQQTFPKDMLLLIVYQENSKDWLRVINGMTSETATFAVTTLNIENVLNNLSSTFTHASKISISIYEPDQHVNSAIVLTIQRWLSAHGYQKYDIYFTGES